MGGYFLYMYLSWVLVVMAATTSTKTEDGGCDKWAQMARDLTGNGKLQSCVNNQTSQCGRLDCAGTLRIEHPNLGFIKLRAMSFDYCYGCQLNSCQKNVSMNFYLQLPAQKVEMKEVVTHNEMLVLKNVNIPFGDKGTVTPVFLFEMERKPDGFVAFSVTMKVELKMFGHKIFMPQLQQTVINETKIPPGICSHDDGGDNPDDGDFVVGACHANKYPTAPTKALPLTPAVVNPSATLNKECDLVSKPCSHGELCDLSKTQPLCQCSPDFHPSANKDACVTYSNLGLTCNSKADCGYNERCHEASSDSKNYVCQCVSGYRYDSQREVCVIPVHGGGKAESTTTPTHKDSSDDDDEGGAKGTGRHRSDSAKAGVDDSNSNTKFIIIGASVGGAILLLLVVLGFACYRRRRNVIHVNIHDSQQPLFSGMGNEDDMNLIM